MKLAGQARESLEKIVKSSERCLDMVRSIAAATEEQSAAIEHVSSNMINIADVFGSSREAVSQINMAINKLARISSELMKLVSWFRTDSNVFRERAKGVDITLSSEEGHGYNA